MLKPPQAARILAIDRDARGTRLLLLKRDEAGVGSADGSALEVAAANVADRHALIRHARGRYYVVDLKSAAGTFVNGNRIRRKQELKHGDILRFGGAAPYRFIDPDALKRRRWRRNLRAGAVVAVLIAVAAVDHFEQWNLFSLATLDRIARVNPPAAPRPAVPPVTKVANAPAPPPAPSAVATAMPGPGRVCGQRCTCCRGVGGAEVTRASIGLRHVLVAVDGVARTDQFLSARSGTQADSR